MDHLIQSTITHNIRYDSRRFDWILGEKVLVSNPDSGLNRSVQDWRVYVGFYQAVGDSKLHLFTSARVCVLVTLDHNAGLSKWGLFHEARTFCPEFEGSDFWVLEVWSELPSVNSCEGDMFLNSNLDV